MKAGPKELARRQMREAQKRPQERVEPLKPSKVAQAALDARPSKLVSVQQGNDVMLISPADLKVIQRASGQPAALYAPAGKCQWCDARRTYARDHMRKLRARE